MEVYGDYSVESQPQVAIWGSAVFVTLVSLYNPQNSPVDDINVATSIFSIQSVVMKISDMTKLCSKINNTGQFSTTRPKKGVERVEVTHKQTYFHKAAATQSSHLSFEMRGNTNKACLVFFWPCFENLFSEKPKYCSHNWMPFALDTKFESHRGTVFTQMKKSSKRSLMINSIKGVIISVEAGECDARRCCSVCGVLACSLRVSPLQWRFLDALFIQALRNLTTHRCHGSRHRKKNPEDMYMYIYKKTTHKNWTNQREEDTTPQKEGRTGRSELRQKSKWNVSWGHPGQFLPWLVYVSVSPQSRTWN